MSCCGGNERIIFIGSLGVPGDIKADNEAINYVIEKFELKPVYNEHRKLHQEKS